jgi:hypothetical protein
MSDVRHITTKEAGKEVVKDTKDMKKALREGRKVVVSAPPPPPVKFGDVTNPLIGNRGLKRALAVALVQFCRTKEGGVDELKLAAMIRVSGICYKSGYSEEKITDLLTQNEWSGRPYSRWASANVKGYSEKHKEKVDKCNNFAQALAKAVIEYQKTAELAKK